jgi:hypothetical protein
MSDRQHNEQPDLERRALLTTAGAAIVAGLAGASTFVPAARAQSTAPAAADRNAASLGARLQGVQHFGLTVQNMDRAFAFYTEVLGGTEIMRDGDFTANASTTPC